VKSFDFEIKSCAVSGAALAVAALLLFSAAAIAQAPAGIASDVATDAASPKPGEADSALRELQDQVRQLRGLVEEMRAENAESRAEMHQLRSDLQSTRALLEHSAMPAGGASENAAVSSPDGTPAAAVPASAAVAQSAAPLEARVQKLEDSSSLLGAKIDEQYQTKVESASKYRARLHGIVLMNAFRNVGGSDNLDFPSYSESVPAGLPQATLGATLRQSEVGFELFGPNIAGARTSADVQFDFAGGFPATGNGVNFGIVRMQTASMRLDWENTSVVAGQDALFISPLSPTSFASLATPAFAFAGNLWGWTPQLRVEHRFSLSDQQTLTMQAGVLDNLDWEPPYNSFYRTPQAGEMSGQPAYALRSAWSRPVNGHPLAFGVAGYYGRQNWAWGRYVDAYSAMADWQIPILPRLGLSGEFYRGRGIGGLGGAIGASIVWGGNPALPYSPIRGLDTAGGWSQLKFQLTPKLEFNGVIAEDDAFAGDVRGFATDRNNFGEILGRNRGALGNVVFRPRSDLILSAEFRRLHTFPIYDVPSATNQLNLSVGILF
jgi:peptidoglycan hydrolase CwlO-like protein